MKYTDLHDKTIFDICDDLTVVARYTGGIVDKDEYLKSLERYPENEREPMRVFAMADYAEDSGNKELLRAIEKQCADIIDGYFKE